MADSSTDRITKVQQGQAVLEEELVRLKILYEKTGSASLRRLIELRLSEAKALYFPSSPAFQVPAMADLAEGEIHVGIIEVEKT